MGPCLGRPICLTKDVPRRSPAGTHRVLGPFDAPPYARARISRKAHRGGPMIKLDNSGSEKSESDVTGDDRSNSSTPHALSSSSMTSRVYAVSN